MTTTLETEQKAQSSGTQGNGLSAEPGNAAMVALMQQLAGKVPKNIPANIGQLLQGIVKNALDRVTQSAAQSAQMTSDYPQIQQLFAEVTTKALVARASQRA